MSAGGFNHFDDVPVGEWRIQTVDPQHAGTAAEVGFEECLDRAFAGRGFVSGGHRVFKVDAHRIRGAYRSLRDHLRLHGLGRITCFAGSFSH